MLEKLKVKNPIDPFWLISSASVFSYLVMTICVKSGFSYGIAILWVVGLIHFVCRSKQGFLWDGSYLLSTYLFYFLVSILINVYHQDILREYDLPLRFLLAIPVIYLLMKLIVPGNIFWYGLFLGAYLGFFSIVSIREQMLNGETTRGVAHLGNMSMIMGLMSFAGWRWAVQRDRLKWTCLLFVIFAGMAGVTGSILSGTRGSWVAVPLVLMIYLFDVAKHLGWSTLRLVALALISAISILVLASQSQIFMHRFDRAVMEAKMILNPSSSNQERMEDTSIGERWLMWGNAIHMIREKPLFGWGRKGYIEYKNKRIIDGEVYPQIAKFTDAHNDYIDILVKKGVIGLTALMAIFLVPLSIFYRRTCNSGADQRAYALCGLVMILVFMVSGLTSTLMTVNMYVMFYSITVILLFSLSRKPPNIFVGSSEGHDHTR